MLLNPFYILASWFFAGLAYVFLPLALAGCGEPCLTFVVLSWECRGKIK